MQQSFHLSFFTFITFLLSRQGKVQTYYRFTKQGRTHGYPTVCHILLFFGPHCSYPNALVTSIMAPAHLRATGVALYLALFSFIQMCICHGNFFGVDCGECAFGWEGQNCDVKKKIVKRRNILHLTSDERHE